MKIDNVEFEGIDYEDRPKYCDAYIVSADKDGIPMTEEELDKLSDDEVYDLFQKFFY